MFEKIRKRRKILMLIPQLGYGGAETSFIRLSNFLAQYHDVTIAVFSKNYGRKEYSGASLAAECPVIILDQTLDKDCKINRWIARWHRFRSLKQQNDVTISFLTGPNLLNVLAGENKKTIVSIRGSRKYDPNITRWLRCFYQYILDPFVYFCAARIVGISAGILSEIVWPIRKLIDRKFTVIELFVNADKMQAQASESIETEIAALEGQPVIVTSGRLSQEKGFQHLIDIFSELQKSIPNAKLLIIGDGPEYSSLERQCASLDLPVNRFEQDIASVIFLGYRESPVRYFKVASVFVLSSITEGFSNSLVEALASGILAMAANTPWGARSVLYDDPPDVIIPYPTKVVEVANYGILMPRTDLPACKQIWIEALNKVLLEPFSYSRLAKLGLKRVHQLDCRVIGNKWLDLIDNCNK